MLVIILSDIIGTISYILTRIMKRTYQPKNKKRIKKFGFRARNKTAAGKRVLKSRRRKGRKSLSASEEYKVKRKKPTKHIR